MSASVMSFNDFIFPYNPQRIRVAREKSVSVTPLPFAPPLIRELSIRPRTVRGEGEWLGSQSALLFRQLQEEFQRQGPGRLCCPLCDPMDAYFVSLTLIGEAGSDSVRFAFEFLEAEVRL